jgi:hypothetical protein
MQGQRMQGEFQFLKTGRLGTSKTNGFILYRIFLYIVACERETRHDLIMKSQLFHDKAFNYCTFFESLDAFINIPNPFISLANYVPYFYKSHQVI